MSSESTKQKKSISPAWLLLGVGLLMGVGIAVATRLPKDKTQRSSWVPLINEKLAHYEQIAMAKMQGGSVADKMLRNYQRRIYALPKKPGLWTLLGQWWVRKARSTSEMAYYKNAEACVKITLALAPGYPGALNLLGLIHIQRHEFKKAIQVARKILSKRKDDAMAWGTLSDAHLERGEYKQAADAVEQMSAIKPNLASYIRAAYLMWIRGEVYQARKLVELAYDAGRGQKDREPVAWVLTEGAKMFWYVGNLKEAEQGYSMALQYKPDYPPALVGKAQIAMARNNPKLAITLLDNAYNQRPLAHTAWLLGDAKSMAGDKEGAAKAYSIVEKLGEDDRRVLALYYATKNIKLKKALKLIKEEYKVRADVYTEDVIAWLMFRLGKFKEAKVRIDRATVHGTKDPMLFYHKAAIYGVNGQLEECKKLLAFALKLNPNFDLTAASEAKRLHKKLQSISPKKK